MENSLKCRARCSLYVSR